jgi:hypothetical protein
MRTSGTLILAACALVLCGCGLAGNRGVPNEQINADLNNKTVKFNGGNDTWVFSPDYERCFLVNESESKIADASAEVPVTLSSWYQSDVTKVIVAINGKALLRYKKDGGKWVLEGIEPKDATRESFSGKAEFTTWLDKHTPVCKGYRYTSY